ncbi:bcl-2-interacting killer isoform X2 [Dipodomys merriami]
MSEAGSVTRDLFIKTLLYQQMPGPRSAAGLFPITEPVGEEVWDPMDCLEGSNQVALWLVCIGDEMDQRLRSPRLAQLPGMAIHSLALTYSQMSVRGVLRRLIRGVAHLRAHIRAWRPPVPRLQVSPGQVRRQLLPAVLLAALLLRGALQLLLQ